MNHKQTPSVTCDAVRLALVEGEPLSPAQDAHLATCATCREAAQDLAATRPFLAQAAPRPGTSLGQSFFIGLRARLQLIQTKERRTSAADSWWEALRRRPALAALVPAAGVAVLVLAFLLLPAKPVGVVGYVEADMRIEQSGATRTALVNTPLCKGAGLVAGVEARGSIYLTERDAWWHVRSGARGRILAPRVVYVDSGECWFEVAPGKGRFQVRTPHGTVDVVGTSFGVRVDPTTLAVCVAGGQVAVGGQDVVAGQQLEVASDGTAGLPMPRAEGDAHPVWVDELARKIAESNFARFYPSVRSTP